MVKKELYFKTIDILVKAYLQGTLDAVHCERCAVGNLCMVGMGYTDMKLWARDYFGNLSDISWDYPVWRLRDGLQAEPTAMTESTGYSVKELLDIETAFMKDWDGCFESEKQFTGLMNVVEALDIIHENTDKELTTEIKAKFQKVNQ